jgi:hypothetical protein
MAAKKTTKKSAAKKSAKKFPSAKPSIPAKAAVSALDDATKKIISLRRDSGKNFHGIGRELLKVSELKLHLARGFSTIEEYAEKGAGLSAASAYQYMRVAEAFTAEVSGAFGVEKLDQALKYIALTPEDEEPKDVPDLRVEVPGENGQIVKKRFEDVTVADLRAASGRLRDKKSKAKGPAGSSSIPDSVAKKAVSANRDLDRAVGKEAAKEATLRLRPRADGEISVDVTGVPLARAPQALRAVAAALSGRT